MITAGVDEVGRGCLAGPVVSAAVILIYSESWLLADALTQACDTFPKKIHF